MFLDEPKGIADAVKWHMQEMDRHWRLMGECMRGGLKGSEDFHAKRHGLHSARLQGLKSTSPEGEFKKGCHAFELERSTARKETGS